jgi:hypothetical protein
LVSESELSAFLLRFDPYETNPQTWDSRGLLQWSIRNVSLSSAERDLETIARKPAISIADFEAATGVVDRVLQVNISLTYFLVFICRVTTSGAGFTHLLIVAGYWLVDRVLVLGKGRTSCFSHCV